jgi:hypothetical protein
METSFLIAPSAEVHGFKHTYRAWEFKSGRLTLLPVRNLVCISCLILLPKKIIYDRISFYADMLEFIYAEIDKKRSYSYLFIAAGSEEQGREIIADIVLGQEKIASTRQEPHR